MGRTQVERNRQARGRGRGRGRGEKKHHAVAPQPKIQETPLPEDDDLDARAEQLLSYGVATSTAVSQFHRKEESSFLFTETTSSTATDLAEQMKRLSQRLEAVPLKDRLRLPDHILEELYGKQQLTKAAVDETKMEERPLEVEDTKSDDDGGDDLDSWLDSVIT